MTITKDMIIGEVLDAHPEFAEYFTAIGMHCLGCPCSRGETIEQACGAHGADLQELLNKLNSAL